MFCPSRQRSRTRLAPHGLAKKPVWGSCPIATNAPATSNRSGLASPVRSVRWVSASLPLKDCTSVFQRTVMDEWFKTLSANTRLARKASRRCMIVTFRLVRAKCSASSMAWSPPPTTATSLPRNKNPSQVAQALMPLPRKVCSPSTCSHRDSAPQAKMMASALISRIVPLTLMLKGRFEKSTPNTAVLTKRAPKLCDCLLISSTRPRPVAYSPTTPGKFSTSTPFPSSWPPKAGATTSGTRPAREA
mmetsp:Transcript_147843/g.473230  ORF Transcript_147843/g.473230 Transcript_147843/m.473230 type:complete len:246 (-) Transcript_147843:1294-2031(-)